MGKNKSAQTAAGGAATAAGMNFQASITTIAYIYMLRGQPLGWMSTSMRDVPVALEVETGTGGDDLRIYVEGDVTLEVQAKKGIAKGAKLWTALLDLATAIADNSKTYGLLAISTTSSGTIRTHLANDIARVGDGCLVGCSEIGLEFIKKLREAKFDPVLICSRLRIHTVAALSHDEGAVAAAKAELGHICQNSQAVGDAWNALHADSAKLIEQRGRRDVPSASRVLTVANIEIATSDMSSPAAVLTKINDFNFKGNSTFSILGVKKLLQTDCDWIDLTAVARDSTEPQAASLSDALRTYHSWESRTASRGAETINPETLARFVKRGVLVAGPGMGKTTLLKRIARRYSEDGVPVLKVGLRAIAAQIQNGSSFENAVFELGLDGSGLTVQDVRKCRFQNWLLLCDGLDECGSAQENVASGIASFAIGYPECRIIITTRPIGYRAAHFNEWRHYDLLALDPSAAHAHAAGLVAAITEEGSAINRDAWEMCQNALQDNEIKEVCGRTPLLVGLAAAIVSNGGALATSKEALFGQIFDLIDSVADTRLHSRPTAPAILRRFVEVLGNQLTNSPLAGPTEILRKCGAVLAPELNMQPLPAEACAQSCSEYWEQVGLIERLGFGTVSAFAFIHKSFGEFAAARFICAMPQQEQTDFIAKTANDEAWSESLRFAASMGLSNKIAAHFVANFRNTEAGLEQLVEMLRIVSEANLSPEPHLRLKVFSFAVKVMAENRSQRAYKIGKHLLAAAKRFPDEVGPLVAPHLGSLVEWTYDVAWCCTVAAGPKYYTLEQLVEVVKRYVADSGPWLRESAAGGILFILGNERGITQEFALAACAEIIDRASPNIADELLPKFLNLPRLGTFGFIKKAAELIRAKGKNYKIGNLERVSFPNFEKPERYLEAEQKAISSILGFVSQNAVFTENLDGSRPLLNLSAFLQASDWMNTTTSECWNWSEDYDVEATKAVIETFVQISGIDPIALRAEAAQAKFYLEARNDNGQQWWSSGLFDVTTSVDPIPVVWGKTKSFSALKPQIEAALSHPSQWLVCLAANMLNELLEPDLRAATVIRLLESGSGNTLWAAGAISSELPKEVAIQVLYNRLRKHLVPGCRHLFDALVRLSPPVDQQLFEVLQFGIFSTNELTARAAAELAKSVSKRDDLLLLPIVESGIVHWQKHEKPYPLKGGVIPDSPRDALVAAKALISPLTYAEIRLLINDKRHEVVKTAETHLVPRLAAKSSELFMFLEDILQGQVKGRHLGSVLKAKIALDQKEKSLIDTAFESEDRNVRLGAIEALNDYYFEAMQIRSVAQRMANDVDQQVKERALTIIEGLDR